MKNIAFFYPSLELGGAQFLFLRMAFSLAKSSDLNVFVIDFENGFLHQRIANQNKIKFIKYIQGDLDLNNFLIILPLSIYNDSIFLFNRSTYSCSFLFWSIHPENITHVLFGNLRFLIVNKRKLREKLLNSANNGSIVFMDRSNLIAFQNEIGIVSNPTFLPVPIEINEEIFECPKKKKLSKINVCWLGRVSYDKVYSILNISKDISESKFSDRIKFYIIGDGEKLFYLKNELSKFNIESVFLGSISEKELSTFLSNNIDIGIAMGTSALEFAKLKIPVALVDYSLKPFRENCNYDWLFDSEEFSLGNNISWNIIRKKRFDDLISDWISDDSNCFGIESFQYVLKNHSMHSVTSLLADIIEKNLIFDNEYIKIVRQSNFPFLQYLMNFKRRIQGYFSE